MTHVSSPGWAHSARLPTHSEPANLVDILERVLDKGIVVAGDIRVDLLDIELLTIRLRLLIASVDRAKEMGIDWWEHDPTLSSGARDLAAENRLLRERIGVLEAGRSDATPARSGNAGTKAGSGARRRKSSA
jgi:hypothetical protein